MGTVQKRVAALLVLLAAAFVLLVPAMNAMQGRHIRLLVEQKREESRIASDIDRLIGFDRTKFANFIIDYTWWDELADFVNRPDPQWAKDNLDSSFDACRAEAIWVYDRELRLVYQTTKPGSRTDARLPFAPAVLRERMASKPYLHAFAKRPYGIVEVRAGRIHRSNDPERTGPFTGYLVAQHAWTDADNQDLGKLTGCSVRLVVGAGAGDAHQRTLGVGEYTFDVPLKDYADQVVGHVEFTGRSRAATVLAETEMRDRWMLIAFTIVIYVGIAVALTRWVNLPLSTISRALADHRADVLPAVEARKDEFGVVAGNLRQFFEQKAMLEQEIAERKRVQAELQASQERLEALTAELQRSNRELQDFASVASHDLQEPLRKISAFGGRLKAKFGDALPADGQDYLMRMLSAVERMSGLIEDLLTYSRVTTRAKPFEPVNLNTLIEEVLGDLETRMQQTGGTVDVGPLPTIEADPTQMRQIFQNLIGNALKFRREGVPPVVRVHADVIEATEGQRVRIVVSDNGIGFDDQYAERIFRVFERLHGREQFEGTGMGLAIVKKIAERHGGTVVAHGVPNEGATFTITLPARHHQTPDGTNGAVS